MPATHHQTQLEFLAQFVLAQLSVISKPRLFALWLHALNYIMTSDQHLSNDAVQLLSSEIVLFTNVIKLKDC